MKESTKNNRLKKEERRTNKAAKKAKNTKKDKVSKPNNLLIFLLIIVIIGGVFGGVKGYAWSKKDATIEKYLEKEEMASLKETAVDEYTTMSLTAKDNDAVLDIIVDTSKASKDEAKTIKEYYKSDDAIEYIKYMASSYLISFKPETRALNASIKYTIKVNDKQIKTEKLTYKQAKKYLKEELEKQKEATTEPVEETQKVKIDTDDLSDDNVIEIPSDTEKDTDDK